MSGGPSYELAVTRLSYISHNFISILIRLTKHESDHFGVSVYQEVFILYGDSLLDALVV